jgi:hypothetical protein
MVTLKERIEKEGITNANAKELMELSEFERKLEEQAIARAEDVEGAEVPDIEGFVESVSISATINLGNYSNTKLEVSASSGAFARKVFLEEIGPTIEMVQTVIKQVSANDEKGVHRSR